jgi:Zn-finger nucleic acid-binding protein
MSCPACGTALRERRTAGILLDECVACGGIWFDRSELEQYRLRAERQSPSTDGTFAARDDLEPRGCPRCQSRTLRHGSIAGQRVFRCTGCRGTFLSRSAVMKLGRVKAVDLATGIDLFDALDAETLIDIVGELVTAIIDS